MPKSKAGRPTLYSLELADRICEKIVDGVSLRKMCEPDDMPAVRSVYNWLREHEEFLQQYTRAKEDQADYLAEQVLEIADDDGLEPADKRIRFDARRWLASKFKPKMYGEKIQQDSNVHHTFEGMEDDELERRITEMERRLNK